VFSERFLFPLRGLENKILIIANAGFHACKSMTIRENIEFIRIPPYTPELNPTEMYGNG